MLALLFRLMSSFIVVFFSVIIRHFLRMDMYNSLQVQILGDLQCHGISLKYRKHFMYEIHQVLWCCHELKRDMKLRLMFLCFIFSSSRQVQCVAGCKLITPFVTVQRDSASREPLVLSSIARLGLVQVGDLKYMLEDININFWSSYVVLWCNMKTFLYIRLCNWSIQVFCCIQGCLLYQGPVFVFFG